jgi:cytochrome c oxidase subunit 2
VVLTDIEGAKADSMDVRVVGEQFTWTFHYRDADGKPVSSHQLYVPVGRQVEFDVQSKDVLHDFWVPAFRVKIDAVRGITTHVVATPNRIGRYPVVCAELCGLGHAAMRQTAHVVSADDFDRWLTSQSDKAQAGGGGAAPEGGGGESAAADGKTIFTSEEGGCQGCHTLSDAGANATIGPDLDKALAGASKAQIRESIVKPNAEIEKGYSPDIMPQNFEETLGADRVDALVDYLAEVTKR